MKLVLPKFASLVIEEDRLNLIQEQVKEKSDRVIVYQRRMSSQHFGEATQRHLYEAIKISKHAFYRKLELRKDAGNQLLGILLNKNQSDN